MKHFILSLIFLLAAFTVRAADKTIEQPPFTVANTSTLEISRIVLSDTATVVSFQAYYRPKYWIKVDAGTYLQTADAQYRVRYGDGIELGKEFWMPDSGEASFNLVFPPLPAGTQFFDFIESDCETCFKIWGIRIDGRDLDPLSPGLLPESAGPGAVAAEEIPEIKKEYAVLEGKLLDYQPAMKFGGSLNAIDLISGKNIEVPFSVNGDGTFRVQMLFCAPTQVSVWSPFFQGSLILAPGRRTEATFNLREIARSRSRLRRDARPYGQNVYFKGAYAALNNDLANRPASVRLTPASEEEYYKTLDEIKEMSPAGFKAYWLDRYRQAVSRIDTMSGVAESYKKFCAGQLALQILPQLLMPVPMLQSAYRKAHPDATGPAPYLADSLPADYYDFLKSLRVDDPALVLCNNYYRLPGLLRALSLDPKREKDPFGVFRYLLDSGTLTAEESELCREFVEAMKAGRPFDARKLAPVFSNHKATLDAYAKETKQKEYDKKALQQLLGCSDALLFDLIDMQPFGEQMADFEPLTPGQTARIEQMRPVCQDILYGMNNELLQKIGENKKKTGYTEHDAPQVPDEQLFETLVAPYRGKVVFVDFWATWCRPCRQAMSAAEPVKAALAGKDIVYLYLTGETSPLGTWKNAIPDIPGEHYRLSDRQWNYLSRQFDVSGIPAYLIINKEGKRVYFKQGFMGADKMKQLLLDELDK